MINNGSHYPGGFKKEMALAIFPAVVSIALQGLFEGIGSYLQHKRDEKKHKQLLEANQSGEPTEKELEEMEQEATENLRVLIREEVVGALKEVLTISSLPEEPSPKQRRDPSRIVRKTRHIKHKHPTTENDD